VSYLDDTCLPGDPVAGSLTPEAYRDLGITGT
jgi:hypothetical protein